MLYIVSTPIGNISDITYRAVEILEKSEIILCEDTRRISKILIRYDIPKKELVVYNDKNKKKQTPKIISLLKEKKEISLVSDAGTPAINDPGFYLIRECIRSNLQISPIPGVSSIIPALVCSGFPTDKFCYYGFVPKTKSKRKKLFQEALTQKATAIFLESPYRIIKTLETINENFPEKNLVLAREMTKKFEEFLRGTPEQLLEKFKGKNPKGEFVIISGEIS